MRKVIQWSRYILLASFLFFYSCKKNSEEVKSGEVDKTELIGKVKVWLEDQKSGLPEIQTKKIDLLKENLQELDIQLEKYRGGKRTVDCYTRKYPI